jgi:hypothetical protein
MKYLVTLFFIAISAVVLATDSDVLKYKSEFLKSFFIYKKSGHHFIKSNFNNSQGIEVEKGIKLENKRDKHINTTFTISKIDLVGENLTVHYHQVKDLRSLGGKLTNETGSFYVAYK